MSRREISISDNLSRMLSRIGSVIAIVLLLLILFLRMEAVFSMNISADVIKALTIVKEWATLAVIIIVGLEAVVKHGFVAFIIFAVIAAAVVVLTFFPAVADQLTGGIALLN